LQFLSLFAHDLFGKPVPTFPDHAPMPVNILQWFGRGRKRPRPEIRRAATVARRRQQQSKVRSATKKPRRMPGL